MIRQFACNITAKESLQCLLMSVPQLPVESYFVLACVLEFYTYVLRII